jgi:CMP-N-acetylneuraminic acid synthetase
MNIKKRLAIVPAKTFSRRIAGKNFKIFYGKPIIYYTLTNLIKTNLFDKIHISTDCKNIKKIIKGLNIDIDFFRKKSLCKGNVGLHEVTEWTIEKYKKLNLYFDTICLAYPTCPLLDYQDYINACKFFEKKKKYPLISVGKYKPSIDEALIQKSKFVEPYNKKKFFQDSKKHKKYFFDSASFVFHSKESIKIKSSKFTPYFLPFEKTLDINTIDDWNIAKKLYKIKNV